MASVMSPFVVGVTAQLCTASVVYLAEIISLSENNANGLFYAEKPDILRVT
jgi:hypothetical protein